MIYPPCTRRKNQSLFMGKPTITGILLVDYEERKTDAFLSSLEGVLDEAQKEELRTRVKLTDTVIQVEELELPFSKALAYMLPSDLPVTAETPTLFPEVLQRIKCAITRPSCRNEAEIECWKAVEPPPGQCTLFAAADWRVGRRKLAQYYAHKLLARHGKVLFIDVRLGRNKFAPPGNIAAIVLEEPILGENFASVRPLVKMVHVGQISYNNLPRLLEALRILLHFLASSGLQDMHWVVTSGIICKGSGLKEVLEAIAIVRPTNVICLAREGCDSLVDQLRPSNNEYELTVAMSPKNFFERSASKRDKSYFLQRMLVSYMSPVLSPPNYLFNTAQPHCFSLSRLVLGVVEMGSEDAIQKRFTHAVVALLCQLPPKPATAAGCLQVSLHVPMQPAIGLGVVMDVDLREGKLYLLTPVPAWEMDKVQVLQLSGVQAPQQMFMDREALDNARAMGSLESAFARLNHNFAASQRHAQEPSHPARTSYYGNKPYRGNQRVSSVPEGAGSWRARP